MITLKTTYLGGLRTIARHIRSSQEITTDAPVDNQGQGQAFSPTDLVCSALCSCMMTIMGQVAAREQISMEGITAEVTKVMSESPRSIAEVIVVFDMSPLTLFGKQRKMLEHVAKTCPVALSLDKGILQKVSFNY